MKKFDMDLVKEYNEKSHFKNANDIFEVLADVLMSGTIKSEYKNPHTIENKEGINSLVIKFLEDVLSNDLANTKKRKLSVINLLDEFNYRNEILHLMAVKNSSKGNELEKTSERMGRKFMSSVKE
ncbi:hypothetical protein [Flavobacterium lipolyticum]|uniref:Uncharacterized protein n=1 Tax=Flavobacterium lipolyticum TaxID=2893754 RepID=A0ABS8M2S6_9FLAO|nr:hypothetical protein [Flavobacterium sp. F-126]MCC9019139.1 hypothetical protein [Flavobacterium sp. F-126]